MTALVIINHNISENWKRYCPAIRSIISPLVYANQVPAGRFQHFLLLGLSRLCIKFELIKGN